MVGRKEIIQPPSNEDNWIIRDIIKNIIIHHALILFDNKGYHGTTMREIGKAAGCQMPTVYYYFTNKEVLFDQVVRVNFEKLLERLEGELSEGLSIKESYIQRVINKKSLSQDEKLIYRLALKTWLGFEGCEVSRQKLIEWEQAAYNKIFKKCMNEIKSITWAKFFVRSFTNIIQRIMLLEEDISDDEIREEISMILEVAMYHKNTK